MSVSRSLLFASEREIQIKEIRLPPLQPGEVRVKTRFSAISAGTELLLYRNQMPQIALDTAIAGMDRPPQYPIQYGYACVGQIIEAHPSLDQSWRGKVVFAFHPHQSEFNASLAKLIPVPTGISPENGLFLANMETAVSLAMDGQPVIGERAIIWGQGVVGLLLAALLARFPLAAVWGVDPIENRRRWAEKLGADAGISPQQLSTRQSDDKFDLGYELTGDPKALNQAIPSLRFAGRLIIGSWYGAKRAPINFGESFHRSHLQIISSQVSQLHPRWRGGWDKSRRFQVAWQMIEAVNPAQLISHRFALADAAQAYQLLDAGNDETLQIILAY